MGQQTATQLASSLVDLDKRLNGDVSAKGLDRMLYATDASMYQELPTAIARPKDAEDCQTLVNWARDHKIGLIPRAAGTGLAGQVVGDGIVVDCSRYMTASQELNKANRSITVEPGVIQDDLNDAMAPAGLRFGPDTSTSNRCMIGGMIGTNACGEHSIIHGTTRDHVLAIDTVLSDGSSVRFEALSTDELNEKKQLNTLEGSIYAGLCNVIDTHKDAIIAAFPKPNIKRRTSGYALDYLANSQPWNPDGPAFNLAPFLCGSEGTLCFTTAAELNLVDLPQERIVVCCHFHSVLEACRANVIAVEQGPSAAELIDGTILGITKTNREQERNRFWLEGEPEAVLVVEFYGDSAEEVQIKADQLIARLTEAKLGHAFPIVKGADITKVWALRKAGLGLLMGVPGDRKAVPIIEDAAVAVEDLPAYIEGVDAILEKYSCGCVYYAHASVGLLHLRPELNLKDETDRKTFVGIAEDIFDLVKQFGGCISGEHGDGRLRGPFLEKMFGPEVYPLFSQIKDIFDPQDIFNPHKIVRVKPIEDNWRYRPNHPTPEFETVFDWSKDEGFVRAVEKCNGAGACRKTAGRGTMCPSYQASHEEIQSTRGRSNIFRQVLDSPRPEQAFTNSDLAEALDLCLSCKGCASECPANVDMARLKAEFLQQKYDRVGIPLRSQIFAHFSLQAAASRMMPQWAQKIFHKPVIKKMLGIHPDRSLPLYTRASFERWWKKHTTPAQAHKKVVLYIDEFSRYLDPNIAIDACAVLEACGCEVIPVWGIDSGRSFISKGLVRKAKAVIEKSVKRLAPYAAQDIPIIGLEPSALLGFRDEAPDLLRDKLHSEALIVQDQAVLFEEFMIRLQENNELEKLNWSAPAQKVTIHEHCQQKSIAGAGLTKKALSCIPGWENLNLLDTGCCGMAGSFGYESEHYELSQQIGEMVLLPAARAADAETILCAPGTSCRHQIKDGASVPSLHPAQIMAQALNTGHSESK